MTNYYLDDEEEDEYENNEEEMVNQEFEIAGLKIKLSEYESFLVGWENLREEILEEKGDEWDSVDKSEVDTSSVVIHEGGDYDEETSCSSSSSEDNHMASEDSEGDDDAKSCFPCPFCYVDIEVPMLCSHLEEEHFFDLKNAVCPLCAASLGKDVIGHFMVHHASSFKTRRKSQKSGSWTGSSATLGKALLKNGRAYAHESTHESAPDPLLSTFICNIPFSDPTGIPQDVCSDSNSSVSSGMKRAEPSSGDEGCEQDKEERRRRAAFVQELIRSTIFLDL